MKILLCVGHSLLKSGAYTSANGYCNEYNYNKKLVNDVVKELKNKGHTVDKLICPEKTFDSAKEEKSYKLTRERAKNYDLTMELHLNSASTCTAHGCEVLYYSEKGKSYAKNIQKGLSKIFTNRGIKKRNDLYMLTRTKSPAVIVESFFCTSKSDYALAKGVIKRKKVAKAITKFL